GASLRLLIGVKQDAGQSGQALQDVAPNDDDVIDRIYAKRAQIGLLCGLRIGYQTAKSAFVFRFSAVSGLRRQQRIDLAFGKQVLESAIGPFKLYAWKRCETLLPAHNPL